MSALNHALKYSQSSMERKGRDSQNRIGSPGTPTQVKRPGSITMTGLLWPSILEQSSIPLLSHRADPTVRVINYPDRSQDLRYGAWAENC